MRRLLLLAVLGLLAPIVFIIGAQPFEVVGQNSLKEIVAGSLALALYFGACQFWVALKGSRGVRINWINLMTMDAPLLGTCLWVAVAEGGPQWRTFSLPAFVSGFAGSLLGALLAARRPDDVTLGRRGRAGA